MRSAGASLGRGCASLQYDSIPLRRRLSQRAYPLREKLSQGEIDLHMSVLAGCGWSPRFVIVIIADAGNETIDDLRVTLRALRGQAYEKWRLVIIDRGLPLARVGDELADGEIDIRRLRHRASRSADADRLREQLRPGFEDLAERIAIWPWNATCGLAAVIEPDLIDKDPLFIGVIGAGDRPAADCLMEFAMSSGLRRDADLLYCDELRVSDEAGSSEPCLKPEWSPGLLL